MTRKLILCISLAMIAVSLTACGSGGTTTATAPAGSSTVTVSEKDEQTSVGLTKGDFLVVELKGNPTTGYQWQQIGADTAILQQMGEPQFTPDSSAVGSPGKVSLRFEAMGPGQTELQLAYQRSFEPQTPAAQTFKINITVK